MEPLFAARKVQRQFEGKPRSFERRERAQARAATLAKLDHRGLVTHRLRKTPCNRQGSSPMGAVIGEQHGVCQDKAQR